MQSNHGYSDPKFWYKGNHGKGYSDSKFDYNVAAITQTKIWNLQAYKVITVNGYFYPSFGNAS